MNKEYLKKLIFKMLIAIAIILVILLSLFVTIAFIVIFIISSLSQETTVYKTPNQYNTCLKSEYYQENIKHFPKNIPDHAQEVSLYCAPAGYKYDSALILLKLKIDKEYIKNELNNHKFLNSKTPVGTVQKIYHMPSESTVGIDRNKLTYYVLDDKYNYNEDGQYFPYFTGIGIDKNYEYILYYYINPDD